MDKQKTTNTKFRAFTYSIMFMFNSICLLANVVMPGLARFGVYFTLFIIACFGVQVLSMRVNFGAFGTIFLVSVFVLGSYVAFNTRDYLINFFTWGILAMLIAMQEYDFKIMMDLSLISSAFIMVAGVLKQNNFEKMTWSYAIFPCIAVTMVHFYCFRENSKLWMKVVYLIGLVTTIVFAATSIRGGILSLICLIYLLMIKKFTGKNLKNKIFVHVIFIFLIIIAVLYTETLIKELYYFSVRNNLNITAISKTYKYLMEDNLTNNRSDLYNFAIKGYLEKPFFGNGVGAFSIYHGGWPHNFILQLLYEGGIVFATIVLFPIISSTILIIKSKTIDKYTYCLFTILFSVSIPRLMFSAEIWNNQAFWMLIILGYEFKQKYGKSKKGGALLEHFIGRRVL